MKIKNLMLISISVLKVGRKSILSEMTSIKPLSSVFIETIGGDKCFDSCQLRGFDVVIYQLGVLQVQIDITE